MRCINTLLYKIKGLSGTAAAHIVSCHSIKSLGPRPNSTAYYAKHSHAFYPSLAVHLIDDPTQAFIVDADSTRNICNLPELVSNLDSSTSCRSNTADGMTTPIVGIGNTDSLTDVPRIRMLTMKEEQMDTRESVCVAYSTDRG